MADCRITVLKRTLNADLAAEYIQSTVGPCESFVEGQEFLSSALGKPDGFCAWAWDDIYKTVVALARGGNFAQDIFDGWMKDEQAMVTCCTDGIRPVIFKVERISEIP